MSVKLSCISWSFHRAFESGDLNIESWLELCSKKLKIGGAEIIADHLESTDMDYLMKIKKLATDLQLTLDCLSPGNNFGVATAEGRAKEVANVKKWIDVGYALGTPVVRIFGGWPEGDRNELWGEMVKCLKEVGDYAKTKGITLVVEHHNGGGFLETSDDVLKMIDEVNSPYVRLNLDTGNFTDDDNYEAIKKTIHLAPHIHAKIHKISKDGVEQEFDYDKIFTILKDADYKGFISVEYEGEEDEMEYAPIAINMVRSYMKKYLV
jgi:sugar phosphate isomerase/epimerase